MVLYIYVFLPSKKLWIVNKAYGGLVVYIELRCLCFWEAKVGK
jgi:hypothetical protein